MNAAIGQIVERDLGTKNDSFIEDCGQVYLLFLLPHEFSRQTTICNFLIHSFNTFSFFFLQKKNWFFLASLQICLSKSLIYEKTIYYADLDTYFVNNRLLASKQVGTRDQGRRSIDSDTAVRSNIQGKLMYLPKYNMHSVTQ